MSLDQIDFVCISLDFRVDRRAQIKEMFEQLGISDRINWWVVSKHPQGGIYGCFESHYSVWHCPEFKRPYLCVFEDDLGINHGSMPELVSELLFHPRERFNSLLEYVQRNCPQKFDLMNLEPGRGYKKSCLSSNVWGEVWAGFFFHTGSYIVSRTILPQISARIRSWYGMDVDTSLYQNCRMVGLVPGMFRQIDQNSNNDGGWRSLFGTPPTANQRVARPERADQSWWGWFSTEMAQLASWYFILGKPQPELIDRRVKPV